MVERRMITESMTATGRSDELALSEDYRRALDAGQLLLHYQPIVMLGTGHVRGVEALLRWQHPAHGLLRAKSFLPAVSDPEVVRATTRWVLYEACRAARQWPGWTMSVNVSARDASQPYLIDDVAEVLATCNVSPTRLVLELTEQALVADMSAVTAVLTALRAFGVGTSLDDFGTGYSSLLSLRELPITEVKIDNTFVRGVPDSDQDCAIVASVVQLAHEVGLGVVAEGVQTRAQARYLQSIGCTAAQGFLWGEPVPARDLAPARLIRPSPALRPTRRGQPEPPSPEVAARILELLNHGASPHTIAGALNRAGVATAAGLRWSGASVASAVAALPEPPDSFADLSVAASSEGSSPEGMRRDLQVTMR
jgi:EAL domain-containing protein (putative c-di-GMP-specific phosphodiesterase class I)